LNTRLFIACACNLTGLLARAELLAHAAFVL